MRVSSKTGPHLGSSVFMPKGPTSTSRTTFSACQALCTVNSSGACRDSPLSSHPMRYRPPRVWCLERISDWCLPRPKKCSLEPGDATEVSRCRRPRSWRCHSSCGGRVKHLFCCRSVFSLLIRKSFGSQEFGCRDNSNTRTLSCFFSELLLPTIRIAASDSVTLFVSTLEPFPMHKQNRTLDTPVGDAFRASYGRGSAMPV